MKDKTRNYLIEQLGSDDSNLITEIYAEFLSAFERNLQIAEKYVEAFSGIAQKGNTLVVPANMGDMATLITGALKIVQGSKSPASQAAKIAK